MAKNAILKRTTRGKKELAAKIKGLRDSLGRRQDGFARDLGVGRTQVVAWESDEKRDQPSVQNLLKMAAMAESAGRYEDYVWFLEIAGVELSPLKAYFARQDALRLNSVKDTNSIEQGLITVVPVMKGFQRRSLAPSLSGWGEFHVSSEYVANPSATIATSIPKASGRLGALPSPLQVEDLVMLDRTLIHPDDFMRSSEVKRIAAILVPRLPQYLTENPRPEGLDIPVQKSGDEITSDFTSPTILFGFLFEQLATEGAKEFPSPREEKTPFRLAFKLGSGQVIPLSKWVTEIAGEWSKDISDGPVLKGAQLFGAVVGWIGKKCTR